MLKANGIVPASQKRPAPLKTEPVDAEQETIEIEDSEDEIKRLEVS
jgi:hypothetical protein